MGGVGVGCQSPVWGRVGFGNAGGRGLRDGRGVEGVGV